MLMGFGLELHWLDDGKTSPQNSQIPSINSLPTIAAIYMEKDLEYQNSRS